ncbi:ABC transporter family substrate-binding protein [Bifidobacterium sp.]|uniref:ABC transporter family substrate-binding protein n=1 Tax=Bifidobacterium sp. TaxID=41200 RepID=UPI0039EB14E2
MRNSLSIRKISAMVVSAAAVVALAACGSGSSASDQTYKTEPSEGTPTSYKGTLPMPSATKAYSNPLSRDKIKQGGTFTAGITEIGPDWNNLSVNGNTAYMASLWKFYQPQMWDYSVDGSKATPNPDYLTSVKLTSTNPETIEFNINPKANYNDGTPIDYKSFVSTWKALNGKDSNYTPAVTAGYDQIASVTRGTSDKQAIVTLSTPYYPYQSLFQNLVNPEAASAATFTKGWENKPHNEWAAGPYIVQSVSDSQVVFVPNPKWWGNKAKLTKVTFKQMETSASINAFKNGEIDVTSASTADRLKTVMSVSDAYIRRAYSSSVNTYTINTKNGAVKDLQVRKALVQAIDRSQIAKISFQGLSWSEKLPGSVILPQFQEGYEDNMPAAAKYSAANAKKTLKADGYKLGSNGYFTKDGKTLDVSYTTFSDDPTIKAEANAMQKMAKSAGIKLDINIKASSEFSDTVTSGDWEIIGLGWSASDPFGYSSSSYQLYGSDSDSNYSFAGTKSIDAKLEKVVQTEDPTSAIKLFNTAEKEAQKLYAQIPTSNGPAIFAAKKGLANYGPAGYASTFIGVPNHTEDLGWAK